MIMRFMVLLGTVLGTIPAAAQEEGPGALLYQEHCSNCHASVARVLRKLPEEADVRRQALTSLLAEHHAPDGAERTQLIEWLVAQ